MSSPRKYVQNVFDSCIERFEAIWQSGSVPDPRRPIPERPFVEDYVASFPELRSGKLTKVIASEYHTRHRWGDQPCHDEYLRRFPQHARTLSEVLRSVDQRLPQPSK